MLFSHFFYKAYVSGLRINAFDAADTLSVLYLTAAISIKTARSIYNNKQKFVSDKQRCEFDNHKLREQNRSEKSQKRPEICRLYHGLVVIDNDARGLKISVMSDPCNLYSSTVFSSRV